MKKGWQTKKLGEVCSFLNRGISPRYLDDGGICVLNQKCVRDHRVSYEPSRRHDVRAKKVGSERLIQVGDVLVNSTGTGTLGRVAQLREAPPEPTTVDSHVTIVRPMPGKFYLEFFGYMLVVIEDAIKEAGEGCGGQTELARSVLAEKFPVHYPESLPEQQRIVGILDEAFEGIATATANAEKNLQNAHALFESHLQSVFTQRGKGWKATVLGDEIDLLAGFAFKSAQYSNADDDIRLLRGDNIIQGYLRWDDVKRWPVNDLKEYDQYQLREGDVVLAMDRPWVRAGLKHATISADDVPCLLVQRTARLRGGANLDNRFLKLLIGSSAFTSHILGVQTGIGVPHISGQQIKDFEFARPPLADQRRIADNLESLREETKRLESLYQQKLNALEALKKSLLHHAFAGQL
jgi:type I restriction enzyme, S subunit